MCITAIAASIGFAVDLGAVEYARYKLHVSAEAVALAAALQASSCSAGSVCAAMQAAGVSAAIENGTTPTSVITNCSATPSAQTTLIIDSAPCLQPGDPNISNNRVVEAALVTSVPLYFARILGINSMIASGRAEAIQAGNPNCIYALDPSAGNSISVDVLATFSSSCGVIDESSAQNAFSCALLSTVHASQVKILGGLQSFLCSTHPNPRTGVPPPSPADPLAYLPKPAIASCGSSTTSPYFGSNAPVTVLLGSAVFYPGTYCGGISILPGANVTFMPGTYILRSGGLLGLQGGLALDMGATIYGDGVTFYNYGPNGGINFLVTSLTIGTVTLRAPASGQYAGVLFFQDPQNTTPAVILGSSSWNTTIEGAEYFPNAAVTQALSGLAKYNLLVAKRIHFAVLTFAAGSLNTSIFGANYSSLPSGSPLAGSGALLVQ